jgi:amino acid transporter
MTDAPPSRSLKRSMRVIGALLLTLSGVTPASSVFISVPDLIQQTGTGAFLGMLFAGLLSIPIAFIYAELSSAFPIAGGEYCMLGRTLGPGPGFLMLGLVTMSNMLSPAVLALGASSYIAAIAPGLDARFVAVAIIAATTLTGILHIRTNAWLTGIFLLIELLALAAITGLGFAHVARPISELALHPVMLHGASIVSTPIALIGVGTSVAIFAYNGYGAACYFAEEMHEAPRVVARTIIWAVYISIVTEFVPTIAVLLGAPDLRALLGSQNAFSDFVRVTGGNLADVVISLCVALAIINAVLALILQNGRFFYSTGRDAAWHDRVNSLFTLTHARFHSPWVATLAAGLSAIVMCFVPLDLLLVLTGTGFGLTYLGMTLAVIAGRWRGTSCHAAYRMPLYPLMPILALLALGYIFYENWMDPDAGRPSLYANLAVIALSLFYYVFVLRRRGGWVLQGPEPDAPQ